MKKFLKELYEKHSTWIIAGLIVLIVVLTAYFNYQLDKKQKKIDEIEYVDTTGTYHKLYYESKFKELKKENRELYDSLKKYKDKITSISHQNLYILKLVSLSLKINKNQPITK